MKISHTQWLLIVALGLAHAATTTTTTPTTTTTAWIDQDYPKAVISLAVLGFAVLVGFGIAKLADWCYERETIRDDASDISENTKELLKAQLALMGFRKPKKTDGKTIVSKEKQREVFNTWAEKARVRKKKRLEAEAKAETAKKAGNNPTSPKKSAPPTGRKSPTKSPTKTPSAKKKEEKFQDAKQQWDDVDEMVPTVLEPKSPTPSMKSKQSPKSKTPQTTPKKNMAALQAVNHPSAVDVTSLSSTDFDFIDETFKTSDKKDTKRTSPNKVAPVPPAGTELQNLKDAQKPQVQNKTQYSRYVREPTTVSQGRPQSSKGAKSPTKGPNSAIKR